MGVIFSSDEKSSEIDFHGTHAVDIETVPDIYRFLVNSMPGIFFLQDLAGKYLIWNEETEYVTGYSKSEISTMSMLSLFDVNDNERIDDAKKIAKQHGNAELEVEIITKNSIRIPYYFIIRSVSYNNQQYYIGSGIDISEELKNLMQMQLSESTFRSAFEFSAFGMALVSPEGKWLKVNSELCNLLGYSEEELLAGNMLDNTHKADLDKTKIILKEFIEGKIETGRLEERYIHKMGNIIWANISMSLIRDRLDIPLYFVAQIEDITDRKEYEGKINNQIALLSEISFITSHELRHEYAKLHSVVNFLKDRQDIFTEKDDQFLIRESIKAFNNINSSIYKINDKITFGQFMEINISGNNRWEHEYILLVDDDPIANYVNTKLIEKYFDNDKIFNVNSSDQGIQHLINNNANNNYIIILDLNMPNKTGWDFLEETKILGFTSPVVILTSSISMADRELAKKYDVIKKFISKPLTDESAMQIKSMK